MISEFLKLAFAMSMGINLLTMILLGQSHQQTRLARHALLLLQLAFLISLWNGYVSLSDGELDHLKLGFLWGFYLWCLGPLLYIYISAMTQSKGKYPLWIHFVIPLIVTFITLTAKMTTYSIPKFAEMPAFYVLYIQILCYGALSYKTLKKHHLSTLRVLSNIGKQSLVWLQYLSCGFVLMWMIDMTTTTLNLLGMGPGFQIYQYYLLIESVLVAGMAILTIRQPEIFFSLLRMPEEKDLKYQTSQFGEEVSDQLKTQLNHIMVEQKPFLDSELNLHLLASLLGVTSHELSQLLNQGYGLNFYEFVNRARIQLSQEMLADTKFSHLSIIDIAYQVGFSNKTTFNRAFRKHTGKTPSTFRQTMA